MLRHVALAALLLTAPTNSAVAQSLGTVLTSSDISSEHLIRRPTEVEGREWLGLVVDGDRSTMQPFRLAWRDTVMFEDSVFTLAVDGGGPSPLLLVADVPGVRAGPATTSLSWEEVLWLEDRVFDVTLGANSYRVELAFQDPMLCDAVVTLTDGTAHQSLYPPDQQLFACDEPHFTVHWAGDIDGDGRLDLVTTFSGKYSWHPRQLWLSSAAPSGGLVGLVATFELAAA